MQVNGRKNLKPRKKILLLYQDFFYSGLCTKQHAHNGRCYKRQPGSQRPTGATSTLLLTPPITPPSHKRCWGPNKPLNRRLFVNLSPSKYNQSTDDWPSFFHLDESHGHIREKMFGDTMQQKLYFLSITLKINFTQSHWQHSKYMTDIMIMT